MTKKQERRRIVVIDEKMQRRMIVAVIWPTTLSFAVTALVLVVLAIRMHTTAAEAGVMLENVGSSVAAVLVFLMAASAFGLFHALKLSHRVAGPAYRLRETLRAAREGDLGIRAHLRKGDYLTETADALNEFLGWLESHPPAAEQTTPQSAAEPTATTSEPDAREPDGSADTAAAAAPNSAGA